MAFSNRGCRPARVFSILNAFTRSFNISCFSSGVEVLSNAEKCLLYISIKSITSDGVQFTLRAAEFEGVEDGEEGVLLLLVVLVLELVLKSMVENIIIVYIKLLKINGKRRRKCMNSKRSF
jgi:hypothetical protein